MRFRYICLLVILFSINIPMLFAQENAQESKALRGELNIIYSQVIAGPKIGLGGYGSDFYNVLMPVARFIERDFVSAKQPLLGAGLEGVMLIPLHSNDNVQLYTSLGYALKYSHERYQINYPIDQFISNVGFGGAGAYELIMLNALTNQLDFGVRIEHTKSLLYGNLSLGVLLYTPLHLQWYREYYDDDGKNHSVVHSVKGNESLLIKDNPSSTGVHALSLRGTSEFLATIGGRVGYGPAFIGINYATNMRVNVISIDIGLTLHPFFRSK